MLAMGRKHERYVGFYFFLGSGIQRRRMTGGLSSFLFLVCDFLFRDIASALVDINGVSVREEANKKARSSAFTRGGW